MGCRHHLHQNLLRLGLRRLRHQRLLPLVVGWQLATSLYTDLALDALEMAIRRRHTGADLTHHSDRGVQHRALRYTERLEQEAAVASVGSKGDSYDNALVEALNSLFKAELIRNKGSWTSINDLEIAVAEYVDWFNQRRLHGELGHVTPAEHEAAHDATEPPVSLQKAS
ncbi:integrase core domain-containing protein [Streptomyces californicus]|uniref:transposase n=1 Tax=Streptomyces californicus TaxID=67351 RepID=UPI0034D9839F